MLCSVVDASDEPRIAEARKELHRLLEDRCAGRPLLLLLPPLLRNTRARAHIHDCA